MKTKLLLAVICMAFMFTVNAQKNIPKGSLLLGGDLSFNSTTYKNPDNTESKQRGFSIAPSVGTAIKDNLFLGLTLGYRLYKNSNSAPSSAYDSTTERGYNAGIFVRKYKPLRNNFYIFLQGSIGGFYTDRSIEDVANRTFYQKDLSVNLSVSPGISYAINSKFQIETGFNNLLGVGYSQTELADDRWYSGTSKRTSFNAYTTLNNFSSQLYIGFRVLLQKKDKKAGSLKAG
ncbi:MAG: outer membrane beta-barrel protein [Ferruginibacter sp.]